MPGPNQSGRELVLRWLPGSYAIARVVGGDVSWAGPTRDSAETEVFWSVTRAAGEALPVTVICPAERVPESVEHHAGWRAIRFEGAFGFGESGVLISVLRVLADAQLPTLTVTTFETDYVLVKADRIARVQQALEEAGHRFANGASEIATGAGR